MELYIGIDISKEKIDVYINGKFLIFMNDKSGMTQFIKLLKKLEKEGKIIKEVIYEPTGGYEKRLEESLKSAVFPRHKVHTNKVKAYAVSKGILAKTDRLDAKLLSDYGRDNPCRVDLIERTKEDEALRGLIIRRDQLVDIKVQEMNRLDKAYNLNPIANKSIKNVVKYLEEQINSLEKEIKNYIKNNKETKVFLDLCQSVSGIGPLTALRLYTDLPELGKREHGEITGLAGLAPRNHDSGKYKGKRYIKGGRIEVRNSLYMAALAAIRCNKPLKEFYQRLRLRGKPFKVAMVAIMRKLLHMLNSIVKRGTPWVPIY